MTQSPLDYRHTTTRPDFAQLPSAVRAGIEAAAGAAVEVAFPSVTTGFTGAYAGLLALRDGRRVFAKAAGPAAPFALEAIPREAEILHRLGGRVTAPTAVGAAAVDDWQLLVLEAIDGHLPGMPWTDTDADAAHAACLELAALDPTAVAELTETSLAVEVGADPAALGCLDELANGARAWPHGIPPLSPQAARELAGLGGLAAHALVGDRLVHSDLRPDNILVTPGGRARFVDWNWVARGPAWCDYVGLLPLMSHDGLDVDAMVRRSPLLDGVDAEAVDAFLAVLTGYFIAACEQPVVPGSQSLVRAHQRHLAKAFLALLSHRRGWS
ncbi:Phosphotransferase enzyme family protein [Pedococcus dokdonensis]|uniref:Phosphotransferase enzyme family protein n=1 Tax=Pedococcus dokdonensis TaxID=443156 RepID=A0A1H0Q651_9MICO|nr:phosphotransferase [Pedococcus dokdonensis]SDP12515.1 Phosphotransferase enzyme family protein [Pedococcus dokdonensis]